MDSPRWETRMVNQVEYNKLLADGWEPYTNHDDRRPGKFWARRRVDIDPQSSGDVAKAVSALEELNRKEHTPAQYYSEGCEILLGLIGDVKVSDAFRMVVRVRPSRRGRTQEDQQRERDLEAVRETVRSTDRSITTEEPEKEQVEVDMDQADRI